MTQKPKGKPSPLRRPWSTARAGRAIRISGPALDFAPAALRNVGIFYPLLRGRRASLLGRRLRPWLEGPCCRMM